MIVCDSSCVELLIVQWILSSITAGSPMVGTPINQVQRPINQGLIKDLISPHYPKPLKIHCTIRFILVVNCVGLLQDFHSHMCLDEVVGYLAGSYNKLKKGNVTTCQRTYIHRAFFMHQA